MHGLMKVRDFTVVIPARYASSRLPAKPLALIGDKPMVLHVAERARASGAAAVWVATDHSEIESVCRAYGVDVLMTRSDHLSGTDRIAEVALRLNLSDDAIVVNVQGDEPLIPPGIISAVAGRLAAHPDAAVATASHAIDRVTEFVNPNVVKVVTDTRGYALYFSRALIPYARDTFVAGSTPVALPAGLPAQRHVGLYAYRVAFLRTYADLGPCDLERFESLEQLRALWHGYRIVVETLAEAPPGGVDTPEDLERVRQVLARTV